MAAITRLSVDGYGARRAGSFAGKSSTSVEVPIAVESYTGGWENYRSYNRRGKTEEQLRLERIRLGILSPDPEPHKPQTSKSLSTPKPVELTAKELSAIKARVKNEIDVEIAIYLHKIEKQRLIEEQEKHRKRRLAIALVLILDAA